MSVYGDGAMPPASAGRAMSWEQVAELAGYDHPARKPEPNTAARVNDCLRWMGYPQFKVDDIHSVNLAKSTFDVRGGQSARGSFYIPDDHLQEFGAALVFHLEAEQLKAEAARIAEQARQSKETPDVSKYETNPVTPSLTDSAKEYGVSVAYRTAAMQLTKRTRGLLADALTQHLKGKVRAAKRRMVLDLLDGPVGDPLVAILLSGILPQAAGVLNQRGAKVDRLAEELRLHAGVVVASGLMDNLFALLGPARDALTVALSGLPDSATIDAPAPGGTVLDMEAERVKAARS